MELKSRRTYDIAPAYLEITNKPTTKCGTEGIPIKEIYSEWSGWTLSDLGHSLTYAFNWRRFHYGVLEAILGYELLEEIDVALSCSNSWGFGECKSSPRLFGPDLVKMVEISDWPVDPVVRSCQILSG